ncbi:MAG TPA: sensor histidine kinase [Opitutaceae bacterium]|nr:sensor histidine kinase [Opitutaceae bacterium]
MPISPPTVPRSSATSWVLTQLAGTPGHHRGRSIAIIVAMVVLIGWLDYITGIRISLVLFYLVPITLGVGWLGWRAGCATAVISVVARTVSDVALAPYRFPIRAFCNRLADLGIYLVLIWVFHSLISLWRELDQRVRLRTADLEQALRARDELQAQLFEISRRERSTIGHDLHDGLGQHLTATAMAANLLAACLTEARQPTVADAQNIVRMLQQAISQTREIARGLLLAAIEPGELIAEIEELAAMLGHESHVECRFTWRGPFAGLDAAISSHLFYIAQEAARNALRHAHPSLVEISLLADQGAIELTVTDNGSGLPAARASTAGMGLRIMAHRAEIVGGEFSIGPAPAGGTRVRCRVPLPAPASPAPSS